MATEPGELDFFPGVDAPAAPIEEAVYGTIVIDGIVVPDGLIRTPITGRL